jgi:hypothetical protein
MSRVPFAVWRPLPENATQSHIKPTQVILHVSAGESTSLFPLWQVENLECHFYSPKVNKLEQYMDTFVMADANYLANRRADGTGAISVETQGLGAGTWNAKQQDDIVALMVWAHRTHGIPLQLCKSPSDPGIGWHIMWGSPGAWTPVSKECPGPDRIKQIPALIDRARDIVAGTQEDISIVDAATKTYLDNQFAGLKGTRGVDLTDVIGKVETTYNMVGTVKAAVVAAIAALPKPAGGVTATVDPQALATAVANEVAKRLAA